MSNASLLSVLWKSNILLHRLRAFSNIHDNMEMQLIELLFKSTQDTFKSKFPDSVFVGSHRLPVEWLMGALEAVTEAPTFGPGVMYRISLRDRKSVV